MQALSKNRGHVLMIKFAQERYIIFFGMQALSKNRGACVDDQI
jgi:hypothetical protein